MCLTIPKQVIATKDGAVKIKSFKGQQKVSSLIRVKKGDWVLTQNGVIIKKMPAKYARHINKLINTHCKKL